MSRRSLTVAVVGLGFGRAHIPAFQAAGWSVVAVPAAPAGVRRAGLGA